MKRSERRDRRKAAAVPFVLGRVDGEGKQQLGCRWKFACGHTLLVQQLCWGCKMRLIAVHRTVEKAKTLCDSMEISLISVFHGSMRRGNKDVTTCLIALC